MRILQGEAQRILVCEIYIRLIKNDHTLLCSAKFAQLSGRIAPPTRRVGAGNEGQCRVRRPLFSLLELFEGWQLEIRFERHRVGLGAMDGGEHWIKRIAGMEKLNNRSEERRVGKERRSRW